MDNGKTNVSSGLCVFCWTSLSGEATKTDSASLQKYLTLIERYFENVNKSDKTLRIPGLEIINRNGFVGTCENCGEILKGVSKLYQEMKCIELKLNWKLDNLKTIVENAAEKNISSKFKRASLKKVGRGDNLEEWMEELLEFQKIFVHKCSLHFKQSYPKLTLKRYHRHDQEAATVTVLDSRSPHLMPVDKSSNGITHKNYHCDERERGRREKVGEAKLKSPKQRKKQSLNSWSETKINKRVPEFRIPELETLETAKNASTPSATKIGPELDKSAAANPVAPEKTNFELTENISKHQINISSIAESIIKNLMLEETESTTTPSFQGDQATTTATTCDHASTSTLKFEEHPILFDDEDDDTMSIDTADPLADSQDDHDHDHVNNCNDGSDNEAMIEMWTPTDETPAPGANDNHCDTDIAESETFLVKRERGSHRATVVNENLTTSSQTQDQQRIIFPTPVKNHDDDDDVMKEVVTENQPKKSEPVSTTPMPEKESVSRFRRRFKCSQCTLTFTSVGNLESHFTSAHVLLDDLNDKDDINGKPEFKLEIGYADDDDAFSNQEDDEHDDTMIRESDSESGQDESEIEASTSVKRKRRQANKRDSKGVGNPQCGKCETWSKESEVPWHVHLAKHRYLHTNGQEVLTDENPKHLNIKWSDLKLEIDGNVVELTEEFTAPDCGRKFALKENFEYHLRLHGNFKCVNADCKTTFSCLMDLVNHEIIHSGKHRTKHTTLTKCARCKFKDKNSRKVFRHYLAAHFRDIIDKEAIAGHECRICKDSFGKVPGCFPMRHFLNFHDLSRIDDPSKVHRCEVSECPAYFLTLKQLEAHHQLHRYSESQKSMPPIKNKKLELRPNRSILASMRKAKITEDGLTVENFVLKKGAEFRCNKTSCGNAAFFTEDELDIHRMLHGDFKCNFCEMVENYAPNLCRHESEVHSKAAVDDRDSKNGYYVDCPRCPKKSSGRPRYIAHHLGKHLGLESDTPRCLICGVLYFAEKKSLEAKIFTHFQEHHDLSSLETTTGDDMVWRCKTENCKAYFLSRFQLSNHVQDKHCAKTPIRKMPCLECGKIFESQNGFSQHMFECHPEAFQKFFPFPCPVDGCVRRCETELTLRRHLYMAHPKQSKQHLCTVCGNHFKNVWSLNGHMKSHDEERRKRAKEAQKQRKVICDQCGSKFKDIVILRIHKLSHSGQESWKLACEICSKKCLTKQKLEEHLRTHTNDKPFQCDHCGASYAHRHNWRIHVQKQHGLDVTRVYKKVNERMKAKYVKNVGDADGQGASASKRKRRAPKRRRNDWEEEESSTMEDDLSD